MDDNDALIETRELLDAISDALTSLVAERSPSVLFERLLDRLVALTGSEYGFIGRVVEIDGRRALRTFAVTNIAWNAETSRLYEENAPDGLLFTSLDDVMREFDDRIAELGLEKIKTMGDAYLVASGLPVARRDHAEAAAELALAMMEVVRGRQRPDGGPLQLRIGMHSGPVAAGVIGRTKFSYDIFYGGFTLALGLTNGALVIAGATRQEKPRGHVVRVSPFLVPDAGDGYAVGVGICGFGF